MATTVEDLVNQALSGIGYPSRIGDLYEGSPAAKAALEVYGQTRDELLAQHEWPFAFREVALSTNGQTPPSPWTYEYTYPSDCIRVRDVRPGPLTGGTRSLDPVPVLYRVWNDQRTDPPVRAVLSDQASAVLVYTGRVTNPATWEPGFTRALVGQLRVKLKAKLMSDENGLRTQIAMAANDNAEGAAVGDMAGPASPMPAQAAQAR